MKVLPCGTASLLLELDDLDAVLATYAALVQDPPHGVLDIVPAALTVLLITDPSETSLTEVRQAVGRLRPQYDRRTVGELVEIPVTYDGDDLEDAARLVGCDVAELIRRHTAEEWTVAFCGFAPGFGYLTSATQKWDLPRRSSPRTKVPTGSVALAGRFTGVYPRESPGGWQLIGRTDLAMFDLSRDPAALLRPGTRGRFIDVGAS
jgi:KipI family sensor histidine kinase inhibitor